MSDLKHVLKQFPFKQQGIDTQLRRIRKVIEAQLEGRPNKEIQGVSYSSLQKIRSAYKNLDPKQKTVLHMELHNHVIKDQLESS